MVQARKLIGLSLIVVLALAVCIPLTVNAAQQSQMKDQVKAEKFIEIAERAYNLAVNLTNHAEEEGVVVTASTSLIDEGLVLLNDAKAAYASGEYIDAFTKAREAQAKFRDAIKTLELPLEEGEEGGGGEEAGRGLLIAISNAQARINRLNDTVNSLSTTITITSEVQQYIDSADSNLTEAQNSLTEAKTAVENGDTSTAAGLLGDANKNIEEAHKALKQIGAWTIAWRYNNFLNGIKKLLTRVEDMLDRAESQGIDVTDLRVQLVDAEVSIENAQATLLAGNIKDALKDTREAIHDVYNILKQLLNRHHPGPPPPQPTEPSETNIRYMGASWNHDPVTVYIKMDNSVDASYQDEVSTALNDWSDALKTKSGNNTAFNFTVLTTPQSNTAPADITINLKKNTGTVLGSTQLSSSAETITSAKIVLATQNALGRPLDRADFRNILRHELGHALGLSHANDNTDLMYPRYDFITVGYDIYPSDLDLNATINLYNTDGFAGTNLHPIPPSYP